MSFLLLKLFLLQFFLVLRVLASLQISQKFHAKRFDSVTLQLLYEFLLFIGLHFYHNVLWLEVSVNDVASFVQVDQTHESISRYLFYQPERHSLVAELVMLNDVQQIRTHQFKHTAHVLSMNAEMNKFVKKQQRSA